MPRPFPQTTEGQSIAIAPLSDGKISVSVLGHPAFELDARNANLLAKYIQRSSSYANAKKDTNAQV